MKKDLFTVYPANSDSRQIYAFGMQDAAILVMAELIKEGKDTALDYVKNNIDGVLYTIISGVQFEKSKFQFTK